MEVEGDNVAHDQVIAELIGMGFEFSDVAEAVKAVGPSLDKAVEYILNDSRRESDGASSSSICLAGRGKSVRKRSQSYLQSVGKLRQSSIVELLDSGSRPTRRKITIESDVSASKSRTLRGPKKSFPFVNSNAPSTTQTSRELTDCKDVEEIGPHWEEKAKEILCKHFGYSSLKPFQKEALSAWITYKDCLVLAATGSGKSLCFQLPAMLSGKVVVVISPLISLMHDQCLKLAKHGISACFLGSGQSDQTVEQKAMSGMYDIIYVCPETILRLIKPLQDLAGGRGIALFAIDEVHCVSKWGHDFRPDYRRLSVLRQTFRSDNLKFLKFDIPLMALTATATIRVQDDILKSLFMSKETKIILTSFFRPNLRFSVKHSKTSSSSSYEKDFRELIEIYLKGRKSGKRNNLISKSLEDAPTTVNIIKPDITDSDESSESDDETGMSPEYSSAIVKEKKLSVEYLEDECDDIQDVDDFDVSCGEFCGQSPMKNLNESEPLDEGPTIIYVPTRKETLGIAKFLLKFGIKAAAYNAKLPKSRLRIVHREFHQNNLQVIVATIAFGMGIDKSNVRRIIHYGWPQSLEAYYQEAGRAGRDGKLADCVLYANLLRTPTLLPSQRSEEQTKQAYKMLTDCFRYGLCTSSCRVKTLVEYFGEKFSQDKCFFCDVCIKGPPALENLKSEAMILMEAIASYHGESSFPDRSCDDGFIHSSFTHTRSMEMLNIKTIVSGIREQHQEFISSDLSWWRGLVRILEDKGFIREDDDLTRVQIKFPKPTELGLEFLRSEDQSFYVYPEADMLLSAKECKPYSSFAEWGKGWADPEIRRQRLERDKSWRKPKKRKSVKHKPDKKTVRGRLAAKLYKKSI